MISLLPFILGLFFILTSFYIRRKSQIFFLYYFVLFAYTFFSQIGYLFYPEKLILVSHDQYYGEETFITYWLYIFLSFISIFLIFIIFYEKKYRTVFSIKVKSLPKKRGNFLYIVLILFYEFILSFFLTKNYENLSYFNQDVLKSNKIWFYLFSLGGIVLLSLFFKIYIEHKKSKKIFYSVLFFSVFLIFSLTAIRSGQRIEVAMALLGFMVSLQYLFRDKIRIKRFIIFIIIFIMISFSQAVRITRGYDETPEAFFTTLMNPETYLIIFNPETLVFQDWLNPSLTLMTSIERDIVFPDKVIESNLEVLVPFFKHESLGEILSRVIDPESNAGYGYYILTEGYNFTGFFGFMYSALIFVLGIRFWESFFTNTKDEIFNAYMYGIMGFLVIYVVRGGQTILFLKGFYLYFLPAIILFILMSNKKVYLTGAQNKN
jgi:hypothetical protein